MALDEYKFIVPEEETNDEKIARLKSELVSMEENNDVKKLIYSFLIKKKYLKLINL